MSVSDGDELEVYGESSGRPLLNADFNLRSVSAERALRLAVSDLRLGEGASAGFVAAGDPLEAAAPAELEPRAAAEMFPAPLSDRGDFDFSTDLRGLAVALESACPRLGWRANLLPVERRKSDSRLLWAPTAALVVLLCLLGLGFLVRPWIQNAAYAAELERRAAELETVAAAADADRAATAEVARKIEVLERLRARTRADLRTLSELSLLTPDTAWLSELRVVDDGDPARGAGRLGGAAAGRAQPSRDAREGGFLAVSDQRRRGREVPDHGGAAARRRSRLRRRRKRRPPMRARTPRRLPRRRRKPRER